MVKCRKGRKREMHQSERKDVIATPPLYSGYIFRVADYSDFQTKRRIDVNDWPTGANFIPIKFNVLLTWYRGDVIAW
jgi:hypothetical protein